MAEQVSQPASPRARAIHHLRRWVESGELGRGEALPSERALAAKLEVGRATVRRALRVLQADGLILDRGGHIRTVAPEQRPGEGVLRGAVVVVMPEHGRLVGMAAVEAAVQAGLGALAIGAEGLAGEKLDPLIVERPMGLVVAGIEPQMAEAMRRGGLNVVVDTEMAGIDRVVVDHEAASYELTKWLIGRGRRRILTLWSGSIKEPAVRDRLAGYERAVREANLEVLQVVQMPAVSVEDGDLRFEAATRLAVGYLTQHLTAGVPIDAIMAETDEDAVAAAEACRILGKEVGKDVLLAGYGGGQRWGGTAATVDLAPAEVGRELVRLLIERVGGKLPDEAQRRVVKGRVVVVESERLKDQAAPAPVERDEKAAEPLFGWKMEGGRWTLGKKK